MLTVWQPNNPIKEYLFLVLRYPQHLTIPLPRHQQKLPLPINSLNLRRVHPNKVELSNIVFPGIGLQLHNC